MKKLGRSFCFILTRVLECRLESLLCNIVCLLVIYGETDWLTIPRPKMRGRLSLLYFFFLIKNIPERNEIYVFSV